jgi:hypothetical protein
MILRKQTRVEILQWLAPLEAAARRMVLLEALTLPKPNAPAPPRFTGRLASAFADRPPPALPEKAEDWRVHFHVFRLPQKPREPTAPRGQGEAKLHFTALALARRVEALRRVLENREAAVRHLAARIHSAPAHADRCFGHYRHKPGGARYLLLRVQREADLALARLNTS